MPNSEAGMTPEEIRALRSRYLGGSLSLAYRDPLEIVRGEGQFLYDSEGRDYLDCVNNVCHVGHCHPRVVEALKSQADRLLHALGDLHPSDRKVELLERLCALSPWRDARAMLSLSGADAVTAALKTAVLATGRPGVIAFEGGYHGLSIGALDATFRPDFRAPFTARLAGKTAFAQGFGRALGVTEPITSPTFTLVHSYPAGGVTLHHADLYRLERTDEIADLVGVPSESFFRATASVGHAELDAVGGDEPAIGDRLQKAISGADRGTARAKKKLETAIHRYRTQGHKNPGVLKVSRAEVEMLQHELAEGEAALSRLQADRAQWVEASERREELSERLTAEGTTFKEIKNQLRRDTALHFLGKQGLSIEEIAHRAGFSESSAFIRAFKGWTGVTPYTYRKGL